MPDHGRVDGGIVATIDDRRTDGPGHHPETARPGQIGNFAVAGHREPGMFWDLDRLESGDPVIVQTESAYVTHVVTGADVVPPTAVEVVAPVPDHPDLPASAAVLTLTTCDPKWDNYQRLVVHATLTGSSEHCPGRTRVKTNTSKTGPGDEPMSMRDFLIRFLVAGVIMAVIDAVWLTVVANKFYKREIGGLLLPKPKLGAAVVFYVIYVVGIVAFVLNPAVQRQSWGYAAGFGALLGLFAYATYDLTNRATLKNFPLKVVLVDMAWGVLLTGTVSTLAYLIVS
jgi:LPXTG-site transpeptidase (sortase) family protein